MQEEGRLGHTKGAILPYFRRPYKKGAPRQGNTQGGNSDMIIHVGGTIIEAGATDIQEGLASLSRGGSHDHTRGGSQRHTRGGTTG